MEEGYINLIPNGGIRKKIITLGSGETPAQGKKVSVQYVGKFENGKIFDSSEEPFIFKVGKGEVIKGWDVGVMSMKVGEKCMLNIKSDYAYGDEGIPKVIPKKSTLLFEVTLLKIH